MRNPFRSEADAFRFVWLTIGYFGLIAVGAAVNSWVGLAVFLVVTGVALCAVFRPSETKARPQAPAAIPSAGHRILVVADETVGVPELLFEIRARAAGAEVQVLLVLPALNTPLPHRLAEEGEARVAAHARLEESLVSMRAAGLDVSGSIGDGDPIQAIEDALRTFRADELIVSTHPAGRSHWLELGVVDRARERFSFPVAHVVIDPDA